MAKKGQLPGFFGVFFLLLGLFPSLLRAEDTGVSGINLEIFQPASDSHGFFSVPGFQTLPRRTFHFRTVEQIAWNHLLEGDFPAGSRDIVDFITTWHLIPSYGITDFLTAFWDIPIHLHARETNVNSGDPFTTGSWGDLRLGFKFRIFDETKKRPGLSFMVTHHFPTGDEAKFLGSDTGMPSFDLIAGKNFKYVDACATVGWALPFKKEVLGLVFDDTITFGSGLKVPLLFWDPEFKVMGEVLGQIQPSNPQIVTSPVSYMLGLQKKFESGLSLSAGAGGALNNAVGNARLRGQISLDYTFDLFPKQQ